MSLKEIGKEAATAGLLALLLNPIVLLILLVIGIILVVVSIGIILYYGLATAIILFIIGAMTVLALHYTKAVNLQKQPYITVMPFIMAIIGYLGERLQIFAIQPLWTTSTGATTQSTQLAIILLLIIFAVAILSTRKR
jgi:membrane-bound ClpP family serine protease